LKGFVTFHGGLKTPAGQDYSKTKGKLLILHGTADTNITMDQFAKLAIELEEKGVSHEMITYSGAPHGFTEPSAIEKGLIRNHGNVFRNF
jgi:dienelactone hydrolase